MHKGLKNTSVNVAINIEVLIVFAFSKHKAPGTAFTPAIRFYAVRTVYFGTKLYNDQRNAQVFNLFIYLLLP
jgi:hypothetical protein